VYSFLLYTRLFVHVFSVESSSGVIMNRISHKTSVVHTCACVEHKIMVYEANFSNFFAKIPWEPLFWAWFSALFSALWANFVRKTLRYFLRYAFWIFLSALHFFQTHNATHQHCRLLLSNPDLSSNNETSSVSIIKKLRIRKNSANKHIQFRSNEGITSIDGVKSDEMNNRNSSDPVTFILSLVLILSSICLFGLVSSLHYCSGSEQWWFLKNDYCDEFNARFKPK